jgi:hypothetical protein
MEFSREVLGENRIMNFVFIGEAGCGKSEIALNLALYLREHDEKEVDFFDLDMTKPLFRSRDQAENMRSLGINFHYTEQYMDAPTTTGGVDISLRDDSRYTILDVGGDYIGARSIGGYSRYLNKDNCRIYYVVNIYRPWSDSINHIDGVLSQTLGVSHLLLDKIHIIANPNLGEDTSEEDIIQGYLQTEQLITPYKPIDMLCLQRRFLHLQAQIPTPVFALDRQLAYEWTIKEGVING